MPQQSVVTARRLALRGPRTRGAAAVEAAIVLPVVLLIFVGIVEFGLIFKDALAVSSAVRAGARIAAADPTNPQLGQDAAAEVSRSLAAVNIAATPAPTLFVYDPDAPGAPPASCPPRSCLRMDWVAATSSFGAPSGSWDPCGLGSTDVAVLVTVQHQGVTGASYASPTLTEKADFAFAPSSSGSVC